MKGLQMKQNSNARRIIALSLACGIGLSGCRRAGIQTEGDAETERFVSRNSDGSATYLWQALVIPDDSLAHDLLPENSYQCWYRYDAKSGESPKDEFDNFDLLKHFVSRAATQDAGPVNLNVMAAPTSVMSALLESLEETEDVDSQGKINPLPQDENDRVADFSKGGVHGTIDAVSNKIIDIVSAAVQKSGDAVVDDLVAEDSSDQAVEVEMMSDDTKFTVLPTKPLFCPSASELVKLQTEKLEVTTSDLKSEDPTLDQTQPQMNFVGKALVTGFFLAKGAFQNSSLILKNPLAKSAERQLIKPIVSAIRKVPRMAKVLRQKIVTGGKDLYDATKNIGGSALVSARRDIAKRMVTARNARATNALARYTPKELMVFSKAGGKPLTINQARGLTLKSVQVAKPSATLKAVTQGEAKVLAVQRGVALRKIRASTKGAGDSKWAKRINTTIGTTLTLGTGYEIRGLVDEMSSQGAKSESPSTATVVTGGAAGGQGLNNKLKALAREMTAASKAKDPEAKPALKKLASHIEEMGCANIARYIENDGGEASFDKPCNK